MRLLLLAAIRTYQRYLSPYKGFGCAYRIHCASPSCSAFGYRAVRRHGVLKGVALIGARTHLCGIVHRQQCGQRRPPLAQRGSCDLPCDGCDLPDASSFSGLCDLLSCCDFPGCGFGGCDWPARRPKKNGEAYVYIPPNADLSAPGKRPRRADRDAPDAPP